MKVFMIAAVSADGFIAEHDEHMADWTSPEDKRFFVSRTKEAGIVVMGGKTFRTIGRAMPGRRNIVYTSQPESISVPDVETTSLSPGQLIAQLEQEGAQEVAICGGTAIYTMFMKSGLIDEMYLTVEPLTFGIGLTLFNEPIEARLTLLDSSKLNDNTLLLHYSVSR